MPRGKRKSKTCFSAPFKKKQKRGRKPKFHQEVKPKAPVVKAKPRRKTADEEFTETLADLLSHSKPYVAVEAEKQFQYIIIPSESIWFDFNKIHEIERNELPEFFNGHRPDHTPESYVKLRNDCVNLYRSNPKRILCCSAIRRISALPVQSVVRVFYFLDSWKLINNQISDVNSLGEVVRFSRDLANQVDSKNDKPVRRKKESENEERPWTRKEEILLLEALANAPNDWNSAAFHIGTRSQQECIQKFISMPIEETYLKSSVVLKVDGYDFTKPAVNAPITGNVIKDAMLHMCMAANPRVVERAMQAAFAADQQVQETGLSVEEFQDYILDMEDELRENSACDVDEFINSAIEKFDLCIDVPKYVTDMVDRDLIEVPKRITTSNNPRIADIQKQVIKFIIHRHQCGIIAEKIIGDDELQQKAQLLRNFAEKVSKLINNCEFIRKNLENSLIRLRDEQKQLNRLYVTNSIARLKLAGIPSEIKHQAVEMYKNNQSVPILETKKMRAEKNVIVPDRPLLPGQISDSQPHVRWKRLEYNGVSGNFTGTDMRRFALKCLKQANGAVEKGVKISQADVQVEPVLKRLQELEL